MISGDNRLIVEVKQAFKSDIESIMTLGDNTPELRLVGVCQRRFKMPLLSFQCDSIYRFNVNKGYTLQQANERVKTVVEQQIELHKTKTRQVPQ